VQNGKQIFNLAASFQTPEEGFEHQAPMPAVRSADDMAAEAEAQKKAVLEGMSEEMRRMMNRPRPVEMVGRDNYGFGRKPKPSEPKSDTWMRAVAPIGDDVRMHQVILAYASDMNLLSTAMRPHGVAWQTPGLQSASLDHAMWFHKPSNFNDWHLYTQDSPSASGGRGFVRGAIYGQDGTLVASVAQEGLMRLKK
ncbi:MAG: acyl-CoA thioesterase, partial [Phenylobacterium sp.]